MSYLEFDQATQKRIVVATDAGVLASINARTGSIGVCVCVCVCMCVCVCECARCTSVSPSLLLSLPAVWRQVLEPGVSLNAVLQTRSLLVSVSAGGSLLRAWDLLSGHLRWETPTESTLASQTHPLSAVWRPGGVHIAASGGEKYPPPSLAAALPPSLL